MIRIGQSRKTPTAACSGFALMGLMSGATLLPAATADAAIIEFQVEADNATVVSGPGPVGGDASLEASFRIDTAIADADQDVTFAPTIGGPPGTDFLRSFAIDPTVIGGSIAVSGLGSEFAISEASDFSGESIGPTPALEHVTAVSGEANLTNTSPHQLPSGVTQDAFQSADDPWAAYYLDTNQFFANELRFQGGGTTITYNDARWSASVPASSPLALLALGVAAMGWTRLQHQRAASRLAPAR